MLLLVCEIHTERQRKETEGREVNTTLRTGTSLSEGNKNKAGGNTDLEYTKQRRDKYVDISAIQKNLTK